MPAARAASSRLIPSRALASASRRLLTRPSRSRRAIARRSAGVRPVAIATATMAQAPGLLSLPGQPAGRRPRSRLPVAGMRQCATDGNERRVRDDDRCMKGRGPVTSAKPGKRIVGKRAQILKAADRPVAADPLRSEPTRQFVDIDPWAVLLEQLM